MASQPVVGAPEPAVSGACLASTVHRRGPLSGAALDSLAIASAAALRAMHDAGQVHHHLNPSAVVLAPDGPRIVDVEDAGAPVASTATGNGDPCSYLAPEQILGLPAGPAADVFSWASTLAFAAAGQPPFTASNPTAKRHKIVHVDPDLIAVPLPLAKILGRCLAKDPQARPTAAALSTILQNALGPAQDVPRFQVRPTPPPVDSGGILVLQPPPAPPPTARTPRRRSWRLVLGAAILVVVAAGAVVAWRLDLLPVRSTPGAPSARVYSSASPSTSVPTSAPTSSSVAASTSGPTSGSASVPSSSASRSATPTTSAPASSSATRSATPTASRPVPRSTSPSKRDPRGAPPAFAGTWSGKLEQPPGSGNTLATTLRLTSGSRTGTFTLPGLDCRAVVTVLQVRPDGRQLVLDERITADPGNLCAPAASIVVTLTSSRVIDMRWQDARNAGNTAAGRLSRS